MLKRLLKTDKNILTNLVERKNEKKKVESYFLDYSSKN